MYAWRNRQPFNILVCLGKLTAVREARHTASGSEEAGEGPADDQEKRVGEATREILSRL